MDSPFVPVEPMLYDPPAAREFRRPSDSSAINARPDRGIGDNSLRAFQFDPRTQAMREILGVGGAH